MTLNDLSTLALQKYGVYGGGEQPSSEDATFVKGALTRALAQLATPRYDIAVWTINDTPDAYADAFITFAGPDFLPTYGVAVDEDMRLAGAQRLRQLTGESRATAAGVADYF